MIVKISVNDSWLQHLNTRLEEAKALSVVDFDKPGVEAAQVFVPRIDGVSYSEMKVENSLRDSFSTDSIEASRWVEREDLFNEAAVWLHEEYFPAEKRILLCEAGYSQAGDASISKKPHVLIDGNPFFCIELSESNSDITSEILRCARSWRLIGFVVPKTNATMNQEIDKMLFLCDAFDGDSIIAVEIAGRFTRDEFV